MGKVKTALDVADERSRLVALHREAVGHDTWPTDPTEYSNRAAQCSRTLDAIPANAPEQLAVLKAEIAELRSGYEKTQYLRAERWKARCQNAIVERDTVLKDIVSCRSRAVVKSAETLTSKWDDENTESLMDLEDEIIAVFDAVRAAKGG